MQLIGDTPEERKAYKSAFLKAKKEKGDTFNAEEFARYYVAMLDPTQKNAENTGVPASVASPELPIIKTPARVDGETVDGDGMPDKVREVVAGIVGVINAYKIEHDINGIFAKEKNGIVRFVDCLATACDEVVKPSRILKRAPYMQVSEHNRGMTNKNAFDTDMLIKFIDICGRMCAREGLPFTRTLYIALTGISLEYFYDDREFLTSASINLRERVLKAEHNASLGMAYGTDIGNMRNLNEGEALTRTDAGAGRRSVGASELRKLTG